MTTMTKGITKVETKLIKPEELSDYLNELVVIERVTINKLETILPSLTNVIMKRSLERQLSRSKDVLQALEKGYVPVGTTQSYNRTDTKDKWTRRGVKEALKTMPQQVREIWERLEAEGFFDSFSITTRGGDPCLVGDKGGRKFFIAAWLCLGGGYALGFTIKQ